MWMQNPRESGARARGERAFLLGQLLSRAAAQTPFDPGIEPSFPWIHPELVGAPNAGCRDGTHIRDSLQLRLPGWCQLGRVGCFLELAFSKAPTGATGMASATSEWDRDLPQGSQQGRGRAGTRA